MRTVVLRVAALALLLLLALVAVITVRTLQRVPDTVVYFIRTEATSFTLEPSYRSGGRAHPTDRAGHLVSALAQGPTSDEAARGLASAVPADTVVLGSSLTDGVLSVDLNAAFERGGGSASMMGRLNQLFYTLTQPSDVDAVVLQVEGRTVGVFGGEGIVVPVPWRRSDQPERPSW